MRPVNCRSATRVNHSQKEDRHKDNGLISWSGHLLPFTVGSRLIPGRYCIHPRPVEFNNTARLTACILRFGAIDKRKSRHQEGATPRHPGH